MSAGYFLKVKETIRKYIIDNGYHLDEDDVMEAIKCAVEDVYTTLGRKVVFDISVMPPEILDTSNNDAEIRVIPFKSMFAVIQPRHFLERIKFFVERFEREKIYGTYIPYKSQIIKAEVMGETFFLGHKSFDWVKVNKRFEGTVREFGNAYNIYVEGGKEKLSIPAGDYRMWDIASHIYNETGYVMSINPHRKILRLKKQNKAVLFNVFGTIAIMPSDERIQTENYTVGDEYDVILYDVNQTSREGYQLYVSRRQIHFITKLLSQYIPEFSSLKIKAIAREPGICCKILVQYSNSGFNGKIKWGKYKDHFTEIQNKLSGEKIEIVEYDPDDIEKTLQDALNRDVKVKVNSFDKTALVVTTNKGAVIGKEGYNVKLAGMLTGFKFTVLTPEEYISTL